MPWNACLRLKLQIRQLWSSNDRTDHANVYGTPDNDTLSSFTRNSTQEGLDSRVTIRIEPNLSGWFTLLQRGPVRCSTGSGEDHESPSLGSKPDMGTHQTGKWVRRSPLGFLPHFHTSSGGDFSPVITITPLQPANQIPALVLILSAM